MRRFFVVLILMILLSTNAYAGTVNMEIFNTYADLFTVEPIENQTPSSTETWTYYFVDDIRVAFGRKDKAAISITGNGDGFLAYSSAALMTMDPDNSHVSANLGQLLTYYLMLRDDPSEKHTGVLNNGIAFDIWKKDGTYTMLVVE